MIYTINICIYIYSVRNGFFSTPSSSPWSVIAKRVRMCPSPSKKRNGHRYTICVYKVHLHMYRGPPRGPQKLFNFIMISLLLRKLVMHSIYITILLFSLTFQVGFLFVFLYFEICSIACSFSPPLQPVIITVLP